MKEYKSFEEIDTDLKILKLQQEIYKEEVKLNYRLSKKYGSPLALIKTAAESVKETVKEKAFVVKRLAEQYFDKFNNKSDTYPHFRPDAVEGIADPDTAIAHTKTTSSSSYIR